LCLSLETSIKYEGLLALLIPLFTDHYINV
jgi:hypothetical protein